MIDKEWVLTDNDSFRICRKLERGLYELYQIHFMSPLRDADKETDVYVIAHDLVSAGNIDKSVFMLYGCDSIEAVREQFGDDWERVLAEWNFEVDSSNRDNILMINSNPYLTWEKARKLICQLSGFTCDLFMNTMMRKKEYSSGRYHFSYVPETKSVRIEKEDKSEIYSVKSGEEMDDLIYMRSLPFGICQYCGLPKEAGYLYEITFFCCKEELEPYMDDLYGEGNWRRECWGEKECSYEYREGKESPWKEELIHYVEWI